MKQWNSQENQSGNYYLDTQIDFSLITWKVKVCGDKPYRIRVLKSYMILKGLI